MPMKKRTRIHYMWFRTTSLCVMLGMLGWHLLVH